MKKNIFKVSILSASVLIGLSACGGGNTNSNSNSDTQNSTTSGPITAFGSIFVNSKEFDTSNASITIEGKPAFESDLKVGMMVKVNKSSGNQAVSVNSNDVVEGIVDATLNGNLTGDLSVMGQTVTVDSNTIFESKVMNITDASKIKIKNVVEVSGYSDGAGNITATRLEVKAEAFTSGMVLEVTGKVAMLDDVAKTFKIGNLEVLFTNAVLSDLPNGIIVSGLNVEVKSTEALNASNQLVASKVEGITHSNSSEVEIKGLIKEISDVSITVNDQVFIVDANTRYIKADMSQFIIGTLVEIEGRLNSNNELVAFKVEFEDDLPGMIKAEFKTTVSSVNATGANMGSIVLGDVNSSVVIIDGNTIMKDSSSANNQTFNLQDIVVGDTVEVKALNNGDMPVTYTAIKVERHFTVAP